MAKYFTYTDQQFLPVSSEVLFDFFSVPENLSKITPKETAFQVVACSKPKIEQGVVLKYKLYQLGIPVFWVAKIEEWVPNHYFVDVQISGPFAEYRHKHILKQAEGGTLILDELEYRLPLGAFGAFFGNFWVRKTLKKTFEFRKMRMEQLFA
jgi:ligand-binding SRPBCC domain-containing protein